MSETCKQTPLVELLQQVPRDSRLVVPCQWNEEGVATGYHMIPIGRMVHEAAAELEAMTKDADEYHQVAENHIQANEALHQQLSAMTKERDEWMAKASRVPEATGAYAFVIEQGQKLQDELVAALAACKVKDVAIERACLWPHDIPLAVAEQLKESLAIQPDDSALMAWFKEQLGEQRVIEACAKAVIADGELLKNSNANPKHIAIAIATSLRAEKWREYL